MRMWTKVSYQRAEESPVRLTAPGLRASRTSAPMICSQSHPVADVVRQCLQGAEPDVRVRKFSGQNFSPFASRIWLPTARMRGHIV